MKSQKLILITLMAFGVLSGCKKESELTYKLYVTNSSTSGKDFALTAAPVYDVDSVTYLSDKIYLYISGKPIEIERNGNKLSANLPLNGVIGDNSNVEWQGKLNSESSKRGTKLYLSTASSGLYLNTSTSQVSTQAITQTIQLQLR